MNKNFKKKEEFKSDNKKMFDKMMTHRKKEVEECKSFYQTRTSLAMNIQNKLILEKKIKDVINNIKNNVEEVPDPKKKKGIIGSSGNDLDEAISLYQEALNVGLKSNYVDELFNILSAKKEEIYKNEISKPVVDPKSKLKEKEKDYKSIANKILAEINKFKWKISEDLMDELNKLVTAV